MVEEKIRYKLYLALTVLDRKTGERKSLPPQFFYGITEWDNTKTLDEAAEESAAQIVVGEVTIDNNFDEPYSRALPTQSVVTVYEFLNYPNDYDDPLKNVTVWDDGWEESYGTNQGAKRYVAHKTHSM